MALVQFLRLTGESFGLASINRILFSRERPCTGPIEWKAHDK